MGDRDNLPPDNLNSKRQTAMTNQTAKRQTAMTNQTAKRQTAALPGRLGT
jgi:hypothetical protein